MTIPEFGLILTRHGNTVKNYSLAAKNVQKPDQPKILRAKEYNV